MGYRFGVMKSELEKEYAVVYTDQRGQGMSQGHLDADQTAITEMTKDIRALAWVLKKKYGDDISLFLMGHSWGGTLGSAYMTTENYQEEFKGWIEVDGAHDFGLLMSGGVRMFNEIGGDQIALGNSVSFWEDAIEQVNEIDTLDYTDDDVLTLNQLAGQTESILEEAGLNAEYTPDDGELTLALTNTLFANNPLTSFITGLRTGKSLADDHDLYHVDYSPLFSNITIPSLILWGRHDFVVSPDLAFQAFDLIGSADKEIIIFERSGHSPMQNEGPAFANAVINFVEKHK